VRQSSSTTLSWHFAISRPPGFSNAYFLASGAGRYLRRQVWGIATPQHDSMFRIRHSVTKLDGQAEVADLVVALTLGGPLVTPVLVSTALGAP